MENSIRDKSLEQLENNYLPIPNENSVTGLVYNVLSLRKKLLKNYSIADLRLCISQNQGLPYLVPIAIPIIEKNPLAGNFPYPGALLLALLTSDKLFWEEHSDYKKRIITIFDKRVMQLIAEAELSEEIKQDLFYWLHKFDNDTNQ
ncbi:contact-dependent growth inhibition system immunity protein [Cytophagaceae bacterium YF14B1]|uniref:Contact-dependent growth inhibition system immunity protein n=1 Tax=Xanthocytophaga flava TaxID=3048013 RepID=A0AAE3QQU1_9BACT|nr:contact-dependent growth inhibition system immunity protein [Xanthocytophaga flavus]MDJ1481043.1 contact-dependent growth inhibition system immunity protein [Xanthocytophaga flavus]